MRQKFSWKIYRVLDQNSRASVRVVRRDQILRIKKYKKVSRNFSSKCFGRWIKSSVISNMLFLSFHIFMRFEVIEKRWFNICHWSRSLSWISGDREIEFWNDEGEEISHKTKVVSVGNEKYFKEKNFLLLTRLHSDNSFALLWKYSCLKLR